MMGCVEGSIGATSAAVQQAWGVCSSKPACCSQGTHAAANLCMIVLILGKGHQRPKRATATTAHLAGRARGGSCTRSLSQPGGHGGSQPRQ